MFSAQVLARVETAACRQKKVTQSREKPSGGNGSNLGFEQKLWQAADALRNNKDAAEYKYVVLGLIFLKYISDAFEEQRAKQVVEELLAERAKYSDVVNRAVYISDTGC